jgi:hypothetical protein
MIAGPLEDFERRDQAVIPGTLVTVLGVVYVHRKCPDGGDLYLTSFGLRYAELLETANWYDRPWFEEHRVRLAGTSSVYRVATRDVAGRSIELVVKNCRVGEDVPVDTQTLREFMSAEFNSPWEEFALVMEMRDSKLGRSDLSIRTQEPLAIYVPPGTMQLWQSGRSSDRINRIHARHPGIDLDILRQYKLVYLWIHGRDIVEILDDLGFAGDELSARLSGPTSKAIDDLMCKGYVVADMKPSHVIIDEQNIYEIQAKSASPSVAAGRLEALVDRGAYSVIDYELLLRTPEHEQDVLSARRDNYLDDQQNRFVATELQPPLRVVELLGVPYVYGQAESTSGRLWVVGRNGRLFDYFLPERWRKTPTVKLSDHADIYYTFTKDHIHLVWKISRVGEIPMPSPGDARAYDIIEHGYNSPFEVAAIAHDLAEKGVGAVFMRAIYMTGTFKVETSQDRRRYETHRHLTDPDGIPVLRSNHNYITLRGYFNGSESPSVRETGRLCHPVNLVQARSRGVIDERRQFSIFDRVLGQLSSVGYDASFVELNDVLVALTPEGQLLSGESGEVDARIGNFELIKKAGTNGPITVQAPAVTKPD